MTRGRTEKNFTEGPLFFRMLIYAVPIILTGLLQMCYNMADHIVVSQFSGDDVALAAIGSTASFTTLVTALLMGIGAGAGVVVAHFIGARRRDEVSRASHTAILFSVISGVALMLLALLISRWGLTLMGTKEEIFERALLYFRIICIGIPASAVYNFGAAILRAAGDSRMPLYILSVSGIINVVLNLIFVILFNMTVDGVAIATITSQYVCAAWVLFVLIRRRSEDYSISLSRLSIDKGMLFRILRLGIPTGLQSSFFAVSNVILASAANQFDTISVTAKTIQGNIDSVSYMVMNAFNATVLTFVGQNYGAMRVRRINRVVLYGLIQVLLIGALISSLEIAFIEPLCSLFIDKGAKDYAIIMELATEVTVFMLEWYVLCGVLDVLSAAVRGLGFSILPMIITMIGACVLRVVWVNTVFTVEEYHTLVGLMTCYPVTWAITSFALAVLLAVALVKLNKKRL